MNTKLRISYDISKPSRDPASYRIDITKTDEPLSELRQIGPVFNNKVVYRGVFATFQEAASARDGYLKK